MTIDGKAIDADTDLGLILELEAVPAMAAEMQSAVATKVSNRQSELSAAQKAGLGATQTINNSPVFSQVVDQLGTSYDELLGTIKNTITTIQTTAEAREKDELTELIGKINEKIEELKTALDQTQARIESLEDSLSSHSDDDDDDDDDDDHDDFDRQAVEAELRDLRNARDDLDREIEKYKAKQELAEDALKNVGKEGKFTKTAEGFTYTFGTGAVTKITVDSTGKITGYTTTTQTETGKVELNTSVDPETGLMTYTTTTYENDLPVSIQVREYGPDGNINITTTNLAADGKTQLSVTQETRDANNMPINSTKTIYGADGVTVQETQTRTYTPGEPKDGVSTGTVHVEIKDGAGNLTTTRDVELEGNRRTKVTEHHYENGKETYYTETTYEGNEEVVRKYNPEGNLIGEERRPINGSGKDESSEDKTVEAEAEEDDKGTGKGTEEGAGDGTGKGTEEGAGDGTETGTGEGTGTKEFDKDTLDGMSVGDTITVKAENGEIIIV